MGFLLQLKLLLWKNFILRKRQKVRCLVELIWPLFLFAILMWVRTRGLKTYIHECHFQEKAMPSAGQVPFLQSFFCSFNNTCHEKVNDTKYASAETLKAGILSQLGNDMENLFRNTERMEKWKKVQGIGQDIDDVSALLQNVTNRQKELKGAVKLSSLIIEPQNLKDYARKENIQLEENVFDTLYNSKIAIQNISLGQILTLRDNPKELLCDKEFLRHFLVTSNPNDLDLIQKSFCNMPSKNLTNFLNQVRRELKLSGVRDELSTFVEGNLGRSLEWEQWRRLNQLSTELADQLQALDSYQELLSSAVDAGKSYMAVSEKLERSEVPPSYSMILMAQRFICGESAVNIIDQFTNSGGDKDSDQFKTLKERLQLNKQTFQEFVKDDDASPECNALFEELEKNSMTRLFWLQIKPFFRGKILFSPRNSAAIDRVMSRVNKTFAFIASLSATSKEWVDLSLPVAREQLVNNSANIRLIRDFVESDIGKRILAGTNVRVGGNQSVNNLTERMAFIQQTSDRLLQPDNFEGRAAAFDAFQEAQTNISKFLSCFDTNKTEGFDTAYDAEKRGMELLVKNKLWAVIDFLNADSDDELDPFISYKIRMDSDRVDDTRFVQDIFWRPTARRRPAMDLKYITFGFAYVQDLIEASIVVEHTGRNSTPGVFLQQFPYPCHLIDDFVMAISRTFPLFMTLSWVYSCSMIIKSIVYEKERRLKETMRVMGLGNAVHWAGWFIDSLIPMIVTIIFLTIILVYGKVVENSDPSVVFVFLLVFCITTITKSFLISTFFSKANLAAAAGGIIFFVMYLPYAFMVIWDGKISFEPKIVASLLSNVAFGFGCNYFALYEQMGVGVQWNNIASSPKLNDEYNLLYVILMLLLDAVIYSIFTWYIETAFPGEFGVPKPWYFPVMRTYWNPKLQKSSTKPFLNGNVNHVYPAEDGQDRCEPEPKHLTLGVSICNLSKIYGNGKVALKDLNINFYEDQITSFLGHNGAGKTTTISIITGMFPPSSGTATIYGLDIRTDMDRIRSSLGMCPQHNVLFEYLSVEEHLWFYARLKGHPPAEVAVEIEQMLTDLGLPHKRTALAKQLSGGMQRKLSIAAAFIGGSKTVILDEPTSGVDPFSRRSIWELLIKYKQGRTVILTTHFMDEADLLGDRIAIISNGKLKCCGSSLFLKTTFGLGYYLTVETSDIVSGTGFVTRENTGTSNAPGNDSIQSKKLEAITNLVQKHVSGAQLIQHLGTELIYNLPERDNKDAFERLFDALDSSMAKLEILSYGVSDTTLEEIFLKVAEQVEDQPPANGVHHRTGKDNSIGDSSKTFGTTCFPWPHLARHANADKEFSMKIVDDTVSAKKQIVIQLQGSNVTYDNVPTADPARLQNEKPATKGSLKMQQFMALHTKRFHHTRRNPKGMFCELVVPALFVCLSLAFTMIFPKQQMPAPLTISPWNYKPPIGVFFSNGDQLAQSNWSLAYQDSLLGNVGISTRCVGENGVRDGGCKAVPAGSLAYDGTDEMVSPKCVCRMGTPTCPAEAGGRGPPTTEVSPGVFMRNMTGRNISDWIVKTTPLLFNKKGFGGFEFGTINPLRLMNLTRISELLRLANNMTGIGSLVQRALPSAVQDAIGNIIIPQEEPSAAWDNIRVWFNNKAWTSSVAYLNAMSNVVLRASLPASKMQNQHLYGIEVITHPMNFTKEQQNDELVQQSGLSLLHAISVIFALSFVPASFVVFLIEERVSNAKHQQLVSGTNRFVYWVAAFCWDMMCYSFSALLCIFVFLAFNEQAYVSSENIKGLMLLLFLYGWSSIPLMYPASFVFSVPSSAFVALSCANLFIGIVTTVATFVLEIFDDAELQYIASIIKEVFLIFPQFCLGLGLMNMGTRHLAAKAFANFGVTTKSDVFEWDFLGKNLLCMFVLGIIFFTFNLMIEFKLFRIFKFHKKPALVPITEEEEDVATERKRVLSGEANSDILLVKNLSKIYGRNKPAVDQLCFGVKKGECFGLLGLNGAGKTSTFKMLTGDVRPSSGDAMVTGFSVVRDMDNVRHHLGYCPQFDALDALLTPREHLELYCRLRGIPSAARHKAVDDGLKRLGLGHYADRCAGTLSGGNKRKLSTAIALVGDPPLVFLDEPTTGMDPKARRFLWSCILDIVAEGRSVVLTSHSMEECQALCTKLTVMVNGRFTCFGSSQHLKNKFGGGYSLVVRFVPGSLNAVVNYVTSRLQSTELRETHFNQARFQLQRNSFKLTAVFRAMERARKEKVVLDYSISQTTLEEVFLRFANDQRDEMTGAPMELHSNV